jgi:hypothetical protein
MQTTLARLATLAAAVAALALCVLAWQAAQRNALPDTGSAWQAVALANGQVYCGRLEAAAEGYVALRDVFYVQTRQNPETRAVANVLVKRGSEAHGPDCMLINRQQLVLVEPVGTNSQIAQLIAQQQGQAAK